MPADFTALPVRLHGNETVSSRRIVLLTVNLDLVMQGAYVVHLGAPDKQSHEELEGRIEEVDTGKSLRFRSGGELIQFLRERLKVARTEPERDK